jgi:hypothetical protein
MRQKLGLPDGQLSAGVELLDKKLAAHSAQAAARLDALPAAACEI